MTKSLTKKPVEPIVAALSSKNWAAARTILSSDAARRAVWCVNQQKSPTLLVATAKGAPTDVIQLIIAVSKLDTTGGSMLEVANKHGNVALLIACVNNSNLKTLKVLIKEGPAMLIATDHLGRTAAAILADSPVKAKLIGECTAALNCGDHAKLESLTAPPQEPTAGLSKRAAEKRLSDDFDFDFAPLPKQERENKKKRKFEEWAHSPAQPYDAGGSPTKAEADSSNPHFISL